MTDGKTSRRVCLSLHKIGQQLDGGFQKPKRRSRRWSSRKKGLMEMISENENNDTSKKRPKPVVRENGKVKAVRGVWWELGKKKTVRL